MTRWRRGILSLGDVFVSQCFGIFGIGLVDKMDNKELFLIKSEQARANLRLLDKLCSVYDLANNRYSPCVNQSVKEFVESNSTANRPYAVGPLPENLIAGKNTHVYDAHTYHTKVPPEAIVRLIEHYTEPGALILDPFCGSGMSGVAALRVGRIPILIDLSPAATFIAMNFLTPIDSHRYMNAVDRILGSLSDEELYLYGTRCRTCQKLVPAEYMVWSYGLICSFCNKEFILWDVARDERESVRESKIRKEFDCPYCGKHLYKRKLQRTRIYPVQVGYRCCDSGLQESKTIPDQHDLSLLNAIDDMDIPKQLSYPKAPFPDGVNTRQAIGHGLTSVDSLYTKRNLRAIARLWNIARRWPSEDVGAKLMFTVTSLYQRVTRLSEFRFWGGSGNIANYNVPMIFNEQNVFKVFHRKAKTIRNYLEACLFDKDIPFCVSTQSATDLSSIPDGSIDYVFTDPPFGGNINYSEMNYLWEAWLGVFTDTKNEAIINSVLGRTLSDYRELLTRALREINRVLKPGRWLTLAFHNSSSKVWAAIRAALLDSGFNVAKVQTLDKRHGTFKQFVSENTVGYDLLLHCTRESGNRNARVASNTHGTLRADVRMFLEQTLKKNPEEFIVEYLHVNRESELDTRKLYSLWLKKYVEAGLKVDLDYESFRILVNQIVADEIGDIAGLEEREAD